MPERELPLFPLNVVLFPGMPLPLRVFEERYKAMMRLCLDGDKTFGVALIESGQEVGGPAVPHRVGTTARVEAVEKFPDGRLNLVAVGVQRFRLLEIVQHEPYLVGRVELLAETDLPAPPELVAQVAGRFRAYLDALGTREQVERIQIATDPVALSFQVAAALPDPPLVRQTLLEIEETAARLSRELALLRGARQRLRLLATAPRDGKSIGPFSTN